MKIKRILLVCLLVSMGTGFISGGNRYKTFFDKENNFKLRYPKTWLKDFSDPEFQVIVLSPDKKAMVSVQKKQSFSNNEYKTIQNKIKRNSELLVNAGETYLKDVVMQKTNVETGILGSFSIKNGKLPAKLTIIRLKKGYNTFLLSVLVESEVEDFYKEKLIKITKSFNVIN